MAHYRAEAEKEKANMSTGLHGICRCPEKAQFPSPGTLKFCKSPVDSSKRKWSNAADWCSKVSDDQVGHVAKLCQEIILIIAFFNHCRLFDQHYLRSVSLQKYLVSKEVYLR